jgi:hypothetical protein
MQAKAQVKKRWFKELAKRTKEFIRRQVEIW